MAGFNEATRLVRDRSEWPESAPPYRQAMPATLSSNQLFAAVFSQLCFHVVQAIDSGAQRRLINDARSLSIRDLDTKIHFHLALFLSDDGLNNRRGLLCSTVVFP